MKFTLRHKLLAAFAGLAALVMVVGAIGTFGARSMGQIFLDYRETSKASLIYNDMKLRLEAAQRSAFIWRTTQSDAQVARFNEQIDIFIHDADLQGMADEHAHADEYRHAFEQALHHQTEQDAYAATQSTLGPQIRTKITDIMRASYESGDAEAAYRARRCRARASDARPVLCRTLPAHQ